MSTGGLSRVVRALAALLLISLVAAPVLQRTDALAQAYVFSLTTVDRTADVGYFSSLDFDKDGNPAIAYYDQTNGNLKLARWNGDSWGMQIVDSPGAVGWFSSLAFSPDGAPGISYQDGSNSTLKFALWTGLSWELSLVDGQGEVGSYTSLAFDRAGRAAISYWDEDNRDLKVARSTEGGWEIDVVDSAGEVGPTTSAAFDTQGALAVSYYDITNGDLKFARRNNASWALQTVDASGDVGTTTSLAFDRQGYPAISYWDRSNSDLKLARWNGSGWQVETVDGAQDVGGSNGLAFGQLGNPAIAYYDYTNGDVKFARWNGAAWDISVIDSEGDVGGSTSFAFDPLGNPAISYRDKTNTSLKLAYNFPPGKPTAVTPVESSTSGRTPTFRWSDVDEPAGVTYQLQVARDSEFSSTSLDKAGLNEPAYSLGAEEALAERAYYWRARATDGGGGVGAWSSTVHFSVDSTPPPVPALLSPAAGTLTNDAAPVLRWEVVAEAGTVTYGLEVDDSPDFSSPVISGSGLAGASHGYELKAEPPPGAESWSYSPLGEGIHYWRVKAVDQAGNMGEWSAQLSFVLDTLAPTPLSGLSPPSGAKLADPTPLLDWDDSADASGVSYMLQLDDDASFSSPSISASGLAPSAYEVDQGEALTSGDYYWRVKAVDGAGNEAPWSKAQALEISSKPAPLSLVIVGIAALALVAGGPALLRSRRQGPRRRGPR